jgi:hypothetical protein
VITPAQSDLINAWVTEQMRQPWPLTSTQLALIKASLAPARPTQTPDGGSPSDAAA